MTKITMIGGRVSYLGKHDFSLIVRTDEYDGHRQNLANRVIFVAFNWDECHFAQAMGTATVELMPNRIRVVIIDDHPAVRRALVARLNVVPDFEVTAETDEVETGLKLVCDQRPDIVLLDPRRADGRGLELIGRVVNAGTGARVVVLTSYTSGMDSWATFQAGAQQYLLKDIGSAKLAEQLRTVMDEPKPPATPP